MELELKRIDGRSLGNLDGGWIDRWWCDRGSKLWGELARDLERFETNGELVDVEERLSVDAELFGGRRGEGKVHGGGEFSGSGGERAVEMARDDGFKVPRGDDVGPALDVVATTRKGEDG